MKASRGLVIAGALHATLLLQAAASFAEPRIVLRVPPFEGAEFANYSAVVLPAEGYRSLEVVVTDALGNLQASTVRVTLNEVPMTPFVGINPMPRGVRAIIRLGVSVSPDYSLRTEGENVVSFRARDDGGMAYNGQFFLSIDPAATAPRLAGLRAQPGAAGVELPPQHAPPTIDIRSQWPAVTRDRTLQLEVEVNDEEGLRRVVIDVNDHQAEEVVFQNERPVRQRQGLIPKGALPGDVTGDGRRVTIAVPIRLDRDRLNVVAVRAENVLGLSGRASRAVEVLK